MEDVFIVKELEQLKGMTDPLRVAVLGQAIAAPVTIAQVAEALGENPRKLYYHFTELERLGLIRVAETRRKGNLLEKWYRAVARFYSVDWSLFHRSPEGMAAFADSITAMLHNSALDFRRRAQDGRLTPEQADLVWPLHHLFRLREDQVQPFRERLMAVLEEFRGGGDRTEKPNAALTLLFYPFTTKVEGEDA